MNWLTYFQQNRANRRTIPWGRGIHVEPDLREPLIHSLQRFQIGETGNGTRLLAGAAATGDAGYREAITLFIQEEHEHARLLERILRSLDADLLTNHWSDTCFVAVRHLMGYQMELVVLLSAEMIAKRYYRALYEGTHDAVLRAVFGQICDDEEGHIDFHCAYLRERFCQYPAIIQWLIRILWMTFFGCVCLVVIWDHRAVLSATNVGVGGFLRDCYEIYDTVTDKILDGKRLVIEPVVRQNS